MRTTRLLGGMLLAALAAVPAPARGHGDELRDRPPPVAADFVPPAPGSYTLQRIMRAPDGAVLDLDGRSRRLADFTTGKITVLSLVYTSCTDAWGCPLASRIFDHLAAAVEESPVLRSRVRLVTLSFDPRHDTPPVMRRYAGDQASRGIDWRFLTTRSERALAPILAGFGQDVRAEDNGGDSVSRSRLTHVLKVFLIDRRGVVREIYSTAYLYPEVVLADIHTLALEGAGHGGGPGTAEPRVASGRSAPAGHRPSSPR